MTTAPIMLRGATKHAYFMINSEIQAHATLEIEVYRVDSGLEGTCRIYALTALAQQTQNEPQPWQTYNHFSDDRKHVPSFRCGFSGRRWQSSYADHLNWCRGVTPAARRAETQARREALFRCAPKVIIPTKKRSSVQTRKLCTCEDWNNDGKYGVVLNGTTVLQPNYGTYSECKKLMKTLTSCIGSNQPSAKKPTKNTCTCEDWNKDGSFGVVLKGKVLRPNYGTYAKCMKFSKTLANCLK